MILRNMLFSNHCLLSAIFFFLVVSIHACPEHEHHPGQQHFTASRIANSKKSTGGLIRPLQWGDVQIIHTTDIHGWYMGAINFSSQPEPNYSGDWGDFASFVVYMKDLAAKRGVDLLLVDSGDLHDGAGLSDGYPPGQGPDAHYSNQFHTMIDFDVLTVGNHELYVYENALDTFQNFVPQQNGRYLASNVNITYTNLQGNSVSEPMGQRYVKFQSERGRNITALGVLYNFQLQDKGLTVQPPAQMVKESWFLDAIKEAPSFFLLAGHMPVRNDDWPVVVNAIRAIHPSVPVVIAGGHTHIRDCYIYDDNAFGIESGRYLETIGWLSFNTTKVNSSTPFSRSYIDANRRNYAYHANLSHPNLLTTTLGANITKGMNQLAQSWNLTQVYGTSPNDYYLSRVPASSSSSLLHLLTQNVLPTVISTSNSNRTKIPNIVIANSGSQRFDIYKGPFTKNDQYVVSPFKDDFLFLEDVPFKYANMIVSGLNNLTHTVAMTPRQEVESVDAIFAAHARESFDNFYPSQDSNATLGYVTKDSCPGLGDDTVHTPIPYAHQPDFVVSPLTNNATAVGPGDFIDVVFLDFALADIITVLNNVQTDRKYQIEDANSYNSLNTQDLYRLYATEAWN